MDLVDCGFGAQDVLQDLRRISVATTVSKKLDLQAIASTLQQISGFVAGSTFSLRYSVCGIRLA